MPCTEKSKLPPEGWNRPMKKLLLILLAAVMLSTALPSVCAEGELYALPLDINESGYMPNPDCVTEDGYEDDSISVRREVITYNKVDVMVAWITIKNPTQLRTACAGAPNSSRTLKPSTIAKSKKAVFALNGEFYVQRTRDIFVYRQGVMYRNDPDPMKDILIIDENADFHLLTSEDKQSEINAFLADGHTIINAFSFGPALVKDGEMCTVRDDYFFDGNARLSRMAIGQAGPLNYVFVRCIGKKLDSRGCNHQEMAEFMSTLGIQSAYNLDGGMSSVMIMNGRYIDDNTHETERAQSDIIYVVSAVNPDK